MKNSKLRRVLLLLACAVMLVSLSVGATLAYLTSTDSVKNTFTVGQVKIKLDEADVKTDGTYEKDHDQRVKANEYHLLPGHEYIKDPTVTVLKGSEKCYVRTIVTVNNIADLKAIFPNDVAPDGTFLIQNFVTGWDKTLWVFEKATNEGDTTKYEFRYFAPVQPEEGEDLVLDDLFETIKFPGQGVTNEELLKLVDDPTTETVEPSLEVNVVAHAIQWDGFADDDAAWTAFDAEPQE